MAFRWPWAQKATAAPQNAMQDSGGGVIINTPDELARYLADGATTKSGAVVNADTAMRQGAVYACVRILSGPPATLPLGIKKRISPKVREDASESDLWKIFNRRPNRWQKPHQFKRMMQAHVLLRGNGIALKVVSRGILQEMIPLDPDRVEIKQNDDLTLRFEYTRKNGGKETFQQKEIFHLFGLTLNGYSGVTPITYARETIGLAMAQEDHGATTFKNGARVGGVLKHPNKLSPEAYERLKGSLDEYSAGGNREGKLLLTEEGMDFVSIAMTQKDAEWVESRKLSVRDIAMFFGVPPSMIGDNSGSDSNWGTGLEQKANGFVTFTLEDYLTMWEEGITIDLNSDPAIYAKYNRNALVKSDIKARWDAYVKALQWGVYCPDDVLELEDRNPRADGQGGKFYDPPNTAGGDKPSDDKEDDDVTPKPA